MGSLICVGVDDPISSDEGKHDVAVHQNAGHGDADVRINTVNGDAEVRENIDLVMVDTLKQEEDASKEENTGVVVVYCVRTVKSVTSQ